MNLKFVRTYASAALFALGALGFGAARADSLTIDIHDFASNGPDTSGNVVKKYLLTPYAVITEIDWNVTLTAYEGNTLDQMFMSITGNLGGGVALEPGYGDDFAGTQTYTGGADLLASDITFLANGSGSVDVEFWNYMDNIEGAADGMWESGTVTIAYTPAAAAVPEPASGVLMLAGLAGAAALARRRRNGASSATRPA